MNELAGNETYVLNTDGGARGNPGPGGAGIVLKDSKGNVIKQGGKFLGICTNNEAEYTALILGLATAKAEGIKSLECSLDSELIVKQLNGVYRVKSPKLKGLYEKVKNLEKDFEHIRYKHVKRQFNKEADAMVNKAIDLALNHNEKNS